MTTINVSAAAKPVSFLSSLVLSPEVADLLQRSYGKGATPIAAEKPAKSKLARAKREKGEKSAKQSTDIVWAVKQPKMGEYQPIHHAWFLDVMRSAGIRQVERVNPTTGEVRKVPVFDEKVYRADAQHFVSIYQGWTNEPFGTQVDRATLHARFALLPKGKTYAHRSAEAHSARWTADGWTAGAPDVFAKIHGDLDARERLAVSEVATLDALLNMSGKTSEKAGFARRLDKLAKEDPGLAALVKQRPDLLGTMLAIAEERLATVRQDIATFDFSDAGAVERRYETLNMRGLPVLSEALSLMHQFAKE